MLLQIVTFRAPLSIFSFFIHLKNIQFQKRMVHNFSLCDILLMKQNVVIFIPSLERYTFNVSFYSHLFLIVFVVSRSISHSREGVLRPLITAIHCTHRDHRNHGNWNASSTCPNNKRSIHTIHWKDMIALILQQTN